MIKAAKSAYRQMQRLFSRPVDLAPEAIEERLSWQTVTDGALRGTDLFLPYANARWSSQMLCGGYEPRLTSTITRIARKSEGALYDIGAHIGYFSYVWMRTGGKEVHAFEPAPANQTIIESILQRNCIKGVTLHRNAVGDVDKDVTLECNSSSLGNTSMAYVKEYGGVTSCLNSTVYASASGVSVKQVSLDSFEDNIMPPALIKCDVEGAEGAVVRGARATLSRFRPILVIETHTIPAATEVAAELFPIGYRPHLLEIHKAMPTYMWIPEEQDVADYSE